MKLCDTCIYRNNVEQLKPCIIYRDDCEYYEKERGDMTREEAIKELQESHDIMRSYDIDESESRLMTALDMAIKALEQEPCDDAVSREDAEQMFRNIRCHLKPQDYKSAEEFNTRDLMLLNAEQMIHALPSVTQESGKWIDRQFQSKIDGEIRNGWECSECGERFFRYDLVNTDEFIPKYCPNCGCRMVEPQESEGKE